MLRVNLSDGTTLRLDLEHPSDKTEWDSISAQEGFQRTIRGAAIQRDGISHTLPLPRRFTGKPHFTAELVWDTSRDRLAAEKLSCYIDSVRVDLTVYANGSPPMSRVDLTKVGNRRHLPKANSEGPPKDFAEGPGAVDRFKDWEAQIDALDKGGL